MHYQRWKLNGDPLKVQVIRNGPTCRYGHPWTEANTAYTKNGARECRKCRQLKKRRHGAGPIKDTVWPAVLERARERCEACGGNGRLEWAHLFGRPATGARLGHLAHDVDLTAALCSFRLEGGIGCHERIDRGLANELRDRLRWKAIERFATHRKVVFAAEAGDSPIVAIKQLVRLTVA